MNEEMDTLATLVDDAERELTSKRLEISKLIQTRKAAKQEFELAESEVRAWQEKRRHALALSNAQLLLEAERSLAHSKKILECRRSAHHESKAIVDTVVATIRKLEKIVQQLKERENLRTNSQSNK